MKISVHNRCPESASFRAARVKSLFNVESGSEFQISADLPVEDSSWRIGVIVGPSGSGKSSLGRQLWGAEHVADLAAGWPAQASIIDAIAPDASMDDATAALAAVGLGNVPTWLRPFAVLSCGEQFRAGLARLLCAAPARVVVDEWSSVVDRQIARMGSLAFAKAWRRQRGQAVLLTCHYDVLEWLQPDWVFDTATGKFTGGCLRRRPPISLHIYETDWRFWPLFEPHHYLKLPRMICSTNYVGTVDGQLICHLAVSPWFHGGCVRACRMVVMPEWQGVGVGMRFLNAVAERQLRGGNRWGRKVPTLFHTSHPGLAAALRRDGRWRQCSGNLVGGSKFASEKSLVAARSMVAAGYGGHFRAVQGFKYYGEALCAS